MIKRWEPMIGIGMIIAMGLLLLWWGAPWQLLAFIALLIIAPSPFMKNPREFIKRKIQNYRIVADYQRQRNAPPTSPPASSYTQGYRPRAVTPGHVADTQQMLKNEHPSAYYEVPQTMYAEE